MTTHDDIKALERAVRETPMDALAWSALADAREECGGCATVAPCRDVARYIRDGKIPVGEQGKKLLRAVKRAVNCKCRAVVVRPATDVRIDLGAPFLVIRFYTLTLDSLYHSRPIAYPVTTPEGESTHFGMGDVIVEHVRAHCEDNLLTVYVAPADAWRFAQ